MFRKTWFWAAFAALSLAAAVFAWAGFSKAFPLVALDASMSRSEALAAAKELAAELGCGPAGAGTALRFSLDGRAQTFVELEGGGTERVAGLIESEAPSLYRWQVRLFEPGQVRETLVSFTPSGRPWGFRETLPQEEPGAALEPEEARALATAALAASRFGVQLSEWEEVERSKETQLSGRVDHGFTWSHRSISFGEGEYRLRATVSGDRLTELRRFIEVPEAFDRRYSEMRSHNEAIAMAGSAGLGSFFFLGVGVALLGLLRRRWLLWKPAFAWGFFIGGLQGATVLNSWPLAWFSYDTAFSPQLFAGIQLLTAAGALLGTGLLLGLTFVAAEGLCRRAFPEHPRLWSLWSKEAASSKPVLGMTVAGYLLVAAFFAYEVALYFLSTRLLGWWSPVGALSDPDALATWFPWLNAIATSAQAGFWEEALCRAIPLAVAAIVGRRFGKERLFVIVALLVQAVVFGAGHAAYPAQPAHARMLELTLPAIGFGLVFLRFGLLAAVVCHYAYDVVWIALPVYGSSADGAWVHQLVVTLLGLAPLLVVGVARLRTGRWGELGEEHLNAGWTPPPAPVREGPALDGPPAALPRRVVLSLGAAGLVGAAAWLGLTRFDSDAPALAPPRAEVLERARGELLSRGLELGPEWRELAFVDAVPDLDGDPFDDLGHDFAWRELGPEGYRDFLRDWAGEPEWRVRRVRFEGEIAARAEEWRVAVTASARARVRHLLPEDAGGPRLGEDTARALAFAELDRRHGLSPEEVDEVEAIPSRLPDRTDWLFSFRVPAAWSGERGEARVFVEIAGRETLRSGKRVFVPESWSREERERGVALALPSAIALLLLALVLGAACLSSLVAWSAGRFRFAAMAVAFIAVSLAGLADAWNAWPSATAGFTSERDWGLQAALTLTGLIAGALAAGTAAGLLAGFAAGWKRPAAGQPWWCLVVTGLGLAAAAAGVVAAAGAWGEALSPTRGAYTAAGTRWPLVTELFSGAAAFVIGSALLIVIVTALDRLTGGLTRRRGLGVGLAALLGLLAGLAFGADTFVGLLSAGGLGALLAPLAWLVLRRCPECAPVLLSAWLAFGRVRSALQGVHPDQALGASLSALLLLGAGLWWSRALRR